MDDESRELMDIFMQSDAPDSVSQRAVDDTGLANYGQPYGSPIAAMPMQSSHSQQSTTFHSMNPTQMMPQDLSPTLMPSDVMMQSPQQQQQRRYPQQHVGYGNGSYHAYGTGYTNQRSLSQSQLSPAATYHGGFQQDGGFMSSRPDFNPTSPTNQGMAPLRLPGVPGVMTSSQSMYYSGNSPYLGNPPISPMAPQGGFSVRVDLTGIPSSSSLPASNLPQMNPEQPFFPSNFPSPSPTQKKMQSNVMANFFQSPLQQPMPAPIRPHQVHAGNIPQQTVGSPVSQTFPQDMAMYTMPQDSFQQMAPFTSTGPGAQLYQQRSCMYADRSASNALQQLYQAQQLKTQGGSLTVRRASYPGPTNHTRPKSPNQRSASSPRSTPSPKVRSPLPSSMPSPPPRQKAPGKVPSPNQNPGQLNRDAFPLSLPTPSPQNQATEQNTGLPNRGNELATPQLNVKKEQAKTSPPFMQTTSPGTGNAVKGNVETAYWTESSSSPAESSPANQNLPPNISPEADSTKKSARAPSADESGSAKSADSEVSTGDARSSEEVNGEKPHQHGCEAEEEKAADSKAAADVPSGETENKGEENSDQDSNVQTTEKAGSNEGQGVEAEKEASEKHAHAENGVVPPKGNSVGEAAKPGGLVANPGAVGSLDEGRTVSSDSQRMTEDVSDLLCGNENLTEELASPKQEEVSVQDLQSYEKLTEDVASPVKEKDKASDLPAETLTDALASPKEEKVTACDPQSSEKASGIPKEKVAENPTKDSPSAMVKTDQVSDLQSSDNASASTKEENVTASNSPHAEKPTKHSTSPKEKKGEASLDVTKGEEEEEEEGQDEEKEERRFSSESQSTQTTQLPKPTPRPLSGQPTTTITAKIIAKGHSAHSNQEVVVAKTPGGQMYLIQGNMLVPVHNITVQEDKDGQGPKVIVVNPSRTATPLKFSNLVTQTPIKTEETKGVVSVNKKSPENSTAAGKDERSAELSDTSGTNAGTGQDSPTKKRIGRPPGSKDKQKRKSHGHKRNFLESPPPKQTPTKFARTVNAIKETKAASSGEQRPANKRALEVPTIRKSGHVSKRHKPGASHSTVRHISVKPRGGADGDAWVCSLCGKAVNENVLGTLYGPYMARLSRERTDSTSKECKSPTKLTSPVRQDPNSVEGSLEEENNSVDLWVHKDCAVWSHGVFMLGRTLHGLEQAVESAASHKCSQCSELGATLACFKRGCEKIFHFACARDSGSSFNEENYTILCSSHKET